MLREKFPCKVTTFSTVSPGKHVAAKATSLDKDMIADKVKITGKDIFTEKTYEESYEASDLVQRPIVK